MMEPENNENLGLLQRPPVPKIEKKKENIANTNNNNNNNNNNSIIKKVETKEKLVSDYVPSYMVHTNEEENGEVEEDPEEFGYPVYQKEDYIMVISGIVFLVLCFFLVLGIIIWLIVALIVKIVDLVDYHEDIHGTFGFFLVVYSIVVCACYCFGILFACLGGVGGILAAAIGFLKKFRHLLIATIIFIVFFVACPFAFIVANFFDAFGWLIWMAKEDEWGNIVWVLLSTVLVCFMSCLCSIPCIIWAIINLVLGKMKERNSYSFIRLNN